MITGSRNTVFDEGVFAFFMGSAECPYLPDTKEACYWQNGRAWVENMEEQPREVVRKMVLDYMHGEREAGHDPAPLDVTDSFEWGDIDGELLPITKCVCGATFTRWDFVLESYSDRPRECPKCGRRFYFALFVAIYEKTNGQPI